MKKEVFLYSALFLAALNFFVWKEVFVLCQPKYLKVDFLAVGQGDAEFIETPGKTQILIDGGPTSAVLEKLDTRMPFWDKEIDIVILTHPESDHMTGILDVLKRYKVKYFLWSGVLKDSPQNKKLLEILKNKKNTKILAIRAGDKIKAGNVLIDFLYPLENLDGRKIEEKDSTNDTCVVNKIIYGKNSFLFTGDIDSKTEKNLKNTKSDVLKVAHHGSKYSTSELFLQNVNPQFAVIEVGKNSYGHPTPEVLQRLSNYGIKILRTDKNNDVNFLSNGNDVYLIK